MKKFNEMTIAELEKVFPQKFIMFPGRHTHPEIQGAVPIYFDFDFSTFTPIKAEGWEYIRLASFLSQNRKIIVYVTGLTPALSHFLKDFISLHMKSVMSDYDECYSGEWSYTSLKPECTVELSLFHYNKELDSYVEQVIF